MVNAVTASAKSPAISVVMPAYNCAWCIEGALACLAVQDFDSFEIIVVDDGSADNTAELVEAFAAHDARCKLVRQSHAGAGAARNTGMALAKGSYVLFLDADDRFEPMLLSTLYERALRSGAQICICAADCFADDSRKPSHVWTAGRSELSAGVYDAALLGKRLFQSTTTVVWDKLFDLSFVRACGLQFQNLPRFNDSYFTIMALANAHLVCKTDAVLVHYRVGQGKSLADRDVDEPLCDLQALDAARFDLAARGLLEGALKQSFDTLCVNVIVYRLAHFARRSERATQALYDAYFSRYERAWNLQNAHWPYLHSPRYAVERSLVRRAGVAGLLRASVADTRDRHAGSDPLAELRFILRLGRQALAGSRRGVA